MSIGLLFWVIMVVGALFSGYNNRTTFKVWVGNDLIIWILLALLGWQTFGPAIHR